MPYFDPDGELADPMILVALGAVVVVISAPIIARVVWGVFAAQRASEGLQERWRGALDDRWREVDPGGPEGARGWAFERDDGARLYHELDTTHRVVFTIDMGDRVPREWRADVALAIPGVDSPPLAERLRESTSPDLSAHADLGRALSTLEAAFRHGHARVALEQGRLTVTMGVLAHTMSLFTWPREAVEDPSGLIAVLGSVVAEFARAARTD